MTEYIHLVGAEEVSRAGRSMIDAADRMSQTALNAEGAYRDHQSFMNDWLQRFEAAIEKLSVATGAGNGG